MRRVVGTSVVGGRHTAFVRQCFKKHGFPRCLWFIGGLLSSFNLIFLIVVGIDCLLVNQMDSPCLH